MSDIDDVTSEAMRTANNDVRHARHILLRAAARMIAADITNNASQNGPTGALMYIEEFIASIHQAHAVAQAPKHGGR